MEINFNGRNYQNQLNSGAKNLNTSKNNQQIAKSAKIYETSNDCFVRTTDKDKIIDDTNKTASYKKEKEQENGQKKTKSSFLKRLLNGAINFTATVLLFAVAGGTGAIGAGAIFGGIHGVGALFDNKKDD